jgi:hypothetical protein
MSKGQPPGSLAGPPLTVPTLARYGARFPLQAARLDGDSQNFRAMVSHATMT